MIDSLKAANTGLRVLDATAQVAHLRGTKSPAELELLRTAARISAMAHNADLTRTVPVNGRYSPEQREIYQIVYDAQQAGERQVKAGAPVKASSDSATAVITAGLARLGLIESADAKIAPAVRKYANIGVRIEDDYIVTAAGFDRITSGAPREMDEIEREMAVRAPLPGRDSALIEAHKTIRP